MAPQDGFELRSVQSELHADCSRCFGLCCVALPFSRSADFAYDKPAGEPCVNLQPDSRCGIHDHLRDRGFRGCVVFDCFGAGQKVSRLTFAGRDWRDHPGTAGAMFAVLPVMRQLHELLWYLTEALGLDAADPVRTDLETARQHVEQLTRGDADELRALDVDGVRGEVNPSLQQASELARSDVPGPRADRRGADLVGARLAGADLRGANLRGARLVASDLTGADLRHADLTGADLRDADLSGADLTDALFLTGAQLTAARGDASTRLPAGTERPGHWPAHGGPDRPTLR